MVYLNDFIALGIISLLGAISPGPDFVVVTQSSLSNGKKAGIATSIGISLGCLVHITYCILGLGVIVSESIVLFNLLKYLGSAYLIYLGIKAIISSSRSPLNQLAANYAISSQEISFVSAMKKGFLVNILNPKVALFILSIFSQLIDPQTPRWIQFLMGIQFSIISFCWFGTLSYLLGNAHLKKRLLSIQHYIEKVLGGFLIILGVKVATMNH